VVFARPLLRLAAIQVPVQLCAVVLLLLLQPNDNGQRPVSAAVFGVLGAIAVAGLALLLFRSRADGDTSP
jgi:heme/copper-type cytochrome/quinol oxidase subunit 4